MDSSNKLFIFSVILVPILLVSVNHATIYDFYAYSVPLNRLTIDHNAYSDDIKTYQDIQNKEGSTCFTTPSQNHFCYTKPRMHDYGGVSYVSGSNGIEGEMHFDPVDAGVTYFTIKNMTRIGNDDALITLSDKNYLIGNEKTVHYAINDKFEFSRTIKKFDTFISHCDNYEGTAVTVVQYLGTTTIDGIEYFITWHTVAISKQGIRCDYPQIIQHSFDHKFKDL